MQVIIAYYKAELPKLLHKTERQKKITGNFRDQE